jgi:NitT/TauT family transport system substrate-binding protein
MRLTRILIPLLVLILAACNSSTKTQNQQQVTIATLKGPSSMGMIRMIDSLANAESKDFKVVILNEPIQVRKMMIDGTADFAILPTTMAAILYNKGLEYRLIAIPVWGTLYLFGSDSTIRSWSDLKGKKVNVMAKGMTPDVLFRYLLEKNGVDPDKDLTLDYSFPTHIDLANAVAAGQAKIGVISEPLVSLVMQRNKEVRPIFDLNTEWEKILNTPIAQTALIAKKSLIEKNPQLVEQFIASYQKSTQWVNSNPDSAAALIVKYGVLPNVEVARNAIPRSNLKFVRAKSEMAQVGEYLSIFYQMNPEIIGGKVPDESFYY